MNNINKIDLLQERIKELSCLYAISSLAGERSKTFEEILQAIVERIPQAWRFPDSAICILRINSDYWSSGNINGGTVSQLQTIFIESRPIGSLAVHYPSTHFNEKSFLTEENTLLHKLSLEIAQILNHRIQKEREEAFLQKVQHQDRLSILGEISAGIAHELNTPLGNILGFAQLILDGERNPQTLADAQKIMNSAIYAREIVKKMMFFSCELPQRFEFISVQKLVKDSIQLLEVSLSKLAFNVEMDFPEQELHAQIDSVQMTQVIFNLISNSIYASKDGSTISIKIIDKKENFKIQISDQGIGIPAGIQEKIFDPFFTTKPTGEGTGLGLSVVHGIIKAHKGTIHVASIENHGTTFSIDLPIKQV